MADPAPVTAPMRASAALLAAHLAVADAIDRRAVDGTGLDPTTTDLLLRLSFAPRTGVRGGELGRQLHLDPGYVSRRIDRAAAAGLVERRPDPDDRRAQLVTLTDRGRAAVERFLPRLHHVLDAVIAASLSEAEIDELVRLLDRVESSARTLLTTADGR
ncbi:MAG: MarR family transcriptional regulator [Actinomycetota bacterium]